ncbi:unnamed protein product [Tetraodon nigroviridis]|uniref:(spotted green pufferfish) hypothetical protein n=1 Tax=Tetraodon nigroviridis TaxID=99883 RepID=Q4RVV5_TETNG|nr:unnamed protein product [Tetraodon nigroviridis]
MEGLADNPGTLWLPGNRVSHYSTVHKQPAPVAQSEKLFSFKVFKNSGDSLDFQLQAIYDHSKDFFWTKSQMLYQRESVSEGPRWASDTCRHINARSLRISADAF